MLVVNRLIDKTKKLDCLFTTLQVLFFEPEASEGQIFSTVLNMENIVGIEFFSGIGGLHYGLERACKDAKVVAAFDTNTHANQVYLENHKLKPSARGIERLDCEYLSKFKANFWLLSPPCQPYTQGGKRLDHEDKRATGLLNIINVLPTMSPLPKYIFLENVPNFELSESRNTMVETLQGLGYEIDEFLVSPMMVGIPNDRKRYYLAAKLISKLHLTELKPIHKSLESYIPAFKKHTLKALKEYIEIDLDESHEINQYYVNPDHIRKRTNFEFDVVTPLSEKTSTFTKSYGSHHFFGAGPMLQTLDLENHYDMYSCDNELLISKKPRFFTPCEVSKLHGFPEIKWPVGITLKQKWKLLGNSLNVEIISVIIKQLLSDAASTHVEKKIKLHD
jgi:tRNA (cytosine38-C5)-methyltransferase